MTCFIFNEKRDVLLFENNGHYTVPELQDLAPLQLHFEHPFLTVADQHLTTFVTDTPTLLPGWHFVDLRSACFTLDPPYFELLNRAAQAISWLQENQYCGCCGQALLADTIQPHETYAKYCPNCAAQHYPRVSPSMIVCVTRNDEILLAHGAQFRKNMYSLLAGFVEPAESLEACVHREVMEEVGITVKNVQYVCSQSWPFPHSLMCGFTADYDSGDIKVDGKEIIDAQWFKRDKMPDVLPVHLSIAWRLINDFMLK